MARRAQDSLVFVTDPDTFTLVYGFALIKQILAWWSIGPMRDTGYDNPSGLRDVAPLLY